MRDKLTRCLRRRDANPPMPQRRTRRPLLSISDSPRPAVFLRDHLATCFVGGVIPSLVKETECLLARLERAFYMPNAAVGHYRKPSPKTKDERQKGRQDWLLEDIGKQERT